MFGIVFPSPKREVQNVWKTHYAIVEVPVQGPVKESDVIRALKATIDPKLPQLTYTNLGVVKVKSFRAWAQSRGYAPVPITGDNDSGQEG